MLTFQEKKKIEDILSDGFRIRKDINFPYFLDSIAFTRTKIETIETRVETIINNQEILDRKLNQIISILNSK